MNPTRSRVFFHAVLTLVACVSLAYSSVANAQDARAQDASPARQLAERYGIDNWPDIEQIDFTFRVVLPDGKVIERPWSWRPQDGAVTANFGTPEATTFFTDAIDDIHRDDHARFINDAYWLLFPFQLVWSTCDVTDDGDAVMPISRRPARKLTVTYPDEGGYTPGDVYELFLDPESALIAEWNFRKGGGDNGRPATWEGNSELNGLLISTEHRGPEDSGFRLTFPRVAVHTQGSVAVADPTAGSE